MIGAPCSPHSVLIAGVVRDGAAELPAVLANVARIAGAFAHSAVLVAENDSVDRTKALLTQWAAGGAGRHVLTLDGIGAGLARTQRLALVRGALIDAVRAHPQWRGFDRLCLIDMDDITTRPIEPASLMAADAFLSGDGAIAGVFANQIGVYYDLCALRHAVLCPDDCWLEVLRYALRAQVPDAEAFAQTMGRRRFAIDPAMAPIEVESAFGGLGLYRLGAVLANPAGYAGSQRLMVEGPDGVSHTLHWQVCEHVSFHRGLRAAGGRLFIMPGLINADCTGVGFPPSGYRSLILPR